MEIEDTLNDIDDLISKLDCETSQIFKGENQKSDGELVPLQVITLENERKNPMVSKGKMDSFHHNEAGEVLELHEFALLGIERTLKENKIAHPSANNDNNTQNKKIKHHNKSPFREFQAKFDTMFKQGPSSPSLSNMKEMSTEKKKTKLLRSNTKTITQRQKSQNQFKYDEELIKMHNIPNKNKNPLNTRNNSYIERPIWLKEMNRIDFDMLGEIVLLNHENFEEDERNQKKKDPSYYTHKNK